MGTLTQSPISLRPTGDGFSRSYFNYTLRHRSPSPVRRKLFSDFGPRSLSSSLPYSIQETISYSSQPSSLPPTYPSTDYYNARKFSSSWNADEEATPSRRSSRATSPLEDFGSRRSSRATSPFVSNDIKKRRSSRRLSRSSREASPFTSDGTEVKKGAMQMFMDSLRSRTPSPSGRNNSESESPRRRSSSVLSDLSRRLSNSPYATLPRMRSLSPSRAMSVISDTDNNSNSDFSRIASGLSTPSPSANATRRLNRSLSRTSRESSPFNVDEVSSNKKGWMQSFIDSLRSRSPSPNGSRESSPLVRRRPSFSSEGREQQAPATTTPWSPQGPVYRTSESASTSGGRHVGAVELSTQPPSAGADGQKVDRAVALLRQLSEDWSVNTEKEEENKVDQLDNNVDFYNHFKRNIRHSLRRSSSHNPNKYTNNNNINTFVDTDSAQTHKRLTDNALAVASHLIEIANRRSPSPPKSFVRSSPTADTQQRDSDGFIEGYSPFSNKNKVGGPLSAPARLDEKAKYFLPFTFPEQFPYKPTPGMAGTNGATSPLATATSPRRFSEENGFRRPLATLHEDEVTARRRFSEEVSSKPYYDTSEVAEELYRHQRRLSEAGVRKISDASVVLTQDTDQFIIGDRVWVGGVKPGVISFIGETQFAPGEWAGVTLDEANGKNDGSVGGVRYFQCEPRKGVFSRLTRLSFVPLVPIVDDDREHEPRCARSSLSPARSISSSARSSVTPTRKVSPPASVASKSMTPARTPMGPPTGASVARKVSNPTPAVPSLASYSNLKIGDRVTVNSKTGTRVGTLRHLGKTEFADGLWAGVELDEPTGKNDGSVAGKKYFSCKPKYGLFSPLACVSKAGTPRRTSATSRLSSATTPLRRSNSRESLGGQSITSSVGASSVASSVRPAYRKPSYGPSHTAARLSSSRAMQRYDVEEDGDGFY